MVETYSLSMNQIQVGQFLYAYAATPLDGAAKYVQSILNLKMFLKEIIEEI